MRVLPKLVLPLLLVLGSCLEMEQSVTIKADGSGTHKVRMTVAEATLGDMQKAGAAAQLGGSANPFAVFDKELVAGELKAAGIELVSHTAERHGRTRVVELEAAFPDFAALGTGPLLGSAVEWVLAPGPQKGTAKLTLYLQGKKAWQEAREKAEQLAAESDPIAMDFFRRRMQQAKGLDLKLRVEVPGEVYVWTKNCKKVDERAIEVRVTPETVATPQDLVRWLSPRFEVIFDARELAVALPE
ncbi:MAG: hypothetical protein RL398_757 [Planctomycetota bacterium]|jgi:hypothetical protein